MEMGGHRHASSISYNKKEGVHHLLSANQTDRASSLAQAWLMPLP